MKSPKAKTLAYGAWLALMALLSAATAKAQGAAPETAPPLFPGGGLISYNSVFTTRNLMPAKPNGIPATAFPTFSHQGVFNFTWGFHRNLDLTVLVPIVTSRYETPGTPIEAGTGIGDLMVLVKWRFYRRDSPRGTTQASVTAGPKLPSGPTDLAATNGTLLPAGLQPGTGSTDVVLAANWTYTGLFNIKRLVADEDFRSLLRTQGTQATRLGSDVESRFWISTVHCDWGHGEESEILQDSFFGAEIVKEWRRVNADRRTLSKEPEHAEDLLLALSTNRARNAFQPTVFDSP